MLKSEIVCSQWNVLNVTDCANRLFVQQKGSRNEITINSRTMF